MFEKKDIKHVFLVLAFIAFKGHASTVKIIDMKNNQVICEIEKNKPFDIQEFKREILEKNKDLDDIKGLSKNNLGF